MERLEELYNELEWVEAEGFKRYTDEDLVVIEGPKIRFIVYPDNSTDGYKVTSLCMKVTMPSKNSTTKAELVCFSPRHHDYANIEVNDIIYMAGLLDLLPKAEEVVYYPEHDMYDIRTEDAIY